MQSLVIQGYSKNDLKLITDLAKKIGLSVTTVDELRAAEDKLIAAEIAQAKKRLCFPMHKGKLNLPNCAKEYRNDREVS